MSAIKPVMCIGTCDVPTVYSNKQSYYECLCYIGYKVNECIDAINQYGDEWKTYVDAQIQEMREYVDAKFADEREYTDSQIRALDNKYSSAMIQQKSELTSLINTVERTLNTRIDGVYTDMESMRKELMAYIKSYVVDNVYIYDPTTGLNSPIQTVVNNLYNALRYWGITASEFDALNLTATNFDAIGISAYEFDMNSGMSVGKSSMFYMSSPFNGEWTYYQDIIYQLASMHMADPFTASEFDASANMTCTAFDGASYTAYKIDNDGHSLLVLIG